MNAPPSRAERSADGREPQPGNWRNVWDLIRFAMLD
jgi:hypothetical protein